MRIAIIGAGIVGVTTAYELSERGHAVTVFERHGSVAEEASFANAGVIVPSFTAPWRVPHWLRLLLVPRQAAALGLAWPLSSADWAWLRRQRRASIPAARAISQAAMQRLTFYSQARLHQMAEQFDYAFDRAGGVLILLRTERERERAQSDLARLRDAGAICREVSANEARRIEPALHPITPLAGAIHAPDGETGNCRQFAVITRDAAERRGAQFVFNATAALDRTRPASVWIGGDAAPRRFDAVVLCAGATAGGLLAPLGIRLPLASIYGYSISVPVAEHALAPRAAVFDGNIVIARLGRRVRVAGLAQIGGHRGGLSDSGRVLPARAEQQLYRALADWFPSAARLTNGVQVWRGARPMLPDGPPVLGASGVPGLWLNLGHGAYGWGMACGSACIMADLIAGRTPEIDLHGLGVERFG